MFTVKVTYKPLTANSAIKQTMFYNVDKIISGDNVVILSMSFGNPILLTDVDSMVVTIQEWDNDVD